MPGAAGGERRHIWRWLWLWFPRLFWMLIILVILHKYSFALFVGLLHESKPRHIWPGLCRREQHICRATNLCIHATTWHLAVGRMPYNEFNRHFVLYNMSTDRRVLNMPTMATTKTIVWLTEIVLDNLYALCTNKFSPTQIRTQI